MPCHSKNGTATAVPWKKKKSTAKGDALFYRSALRSALEAPPGFEPGIKDLQSHALPLGYGATSDLLRSNTNGFAVCFFRSANLPFSNRTRFDANSAPRNLTGRVGLRFDSCVLRFSNSPAASVDAPFFSGLLAAARGRASIRSVSGKLP
jgi:hypothetical protein